MRIPLDQGESRDENFRLWFHRPLAIYYEIDVVNQIVSVSAIKWVGR
jgi:hypothetical protein